MEEFIKLQQLVAQAQEDVDKVDKGNAAAGTRVRKAMQEIKAQAQVVREKIMEMRSAGEKPADAPATQPQ